MSGPKGRDNQNFLDRYGQALVDNLQDVGKGVELIAQGQVSKGLDRGLQGGLGLYTYGASNVVTGGSSTTNERANQIADDKRAAAEVKNTQDIAVAANEDRLTKIKDRLSEEIRLRQKTPGRSQTLLTSSLTPSGTNTNTLLTAATSGVKR